MKTSPSLLKQEDLVWGITSFWKHRHGKNAGAIREIIRSYIKSLKELR